MQELKFGGEWILAEDEVLVPMDMSKDIPHGRFRRGRHYEGG